MDNLLNIALRATSPDQDIDREYVLCLGKDLLGAWTVMVHYGRYGRRGVAKNVSFTTRQEACQYINLKLKVRLSARKRIGCDYRLTKLDGRQSFMQSMNRQVMEGFSGCVGELFCAGTNGGSSQNYLLNQEYEDRSID